MTKKVFCLQLAAFGLTLVGVAGLGAALFGRGGPDLTAVYVFAGLGIVGFVGNAALALLRVLLEKDGRS